MDRADVQFERFSDRIRDDAELQEFCHGDPRHSDMLRTLLGGSAFVSDILIRDPHLFLVFATEQADARVRLRATGRTAVEMEQLVHAALDGTTEYEERRIALRRMHRRELFRIAASDLLSLWDMPTVASQLSILADSMIRAALDIAAAAESAVPAGLAIVGMGKLGGRELNYSSDIDLIFVAGSDAMRYSKMGARVIDVLGGVTHEGFLYRVDMRLRPWGRSGALVHTIDSYEKYLSTHGEQWERQALLKARPLAGNSVVGAEFLSRLRPLVLATEPEDIRRDVADMKERIERELIRKNDTWGNVKLGRGSIRDVEFTVQCLQLIHGRSNPAVVSGSTREALALLHDHGILSSDDRRVLNDGYTFLRVVEHHLQLFDNRQTHSLPGDMGAMNELARRLQFEEPNPGRQLVEHFERHSRMVRAVFERIVAGEAATADSDEPSLPPIAAAMAPAYRETFSADEIQRHSQLIDRLTTDRRVVVQPARLNGSWRLTVVGYDQTGALSVITGLLFAYGFDIVDGHIFTDEQRDSGSGLRRLIDRPIIVDVFTIRAVASEHPDVDWQRYEEELSAVLADMSSGRGKEALVYLTERVAESRPKASPDSSPVLQPVDITVDNETDDRFTILNIESADAAGFLYELANALSLLNVDIARMVVETAGERVRDTLYVTNSKGGPIRDSGRERQLRLTAVLVQHFTRLLPHASNPTAALLQFRALLGDLLTRDDWVDDLASLEQPSVLNALTRILGVGSSLWTDFLRMQHETLFPLIGDDEGLSRPRGASELESEFRSELQQAQSDQEWIDALNRLKDRELFRIDMRYILGRIDEFGQFSSELADLAEVVVKLALESSLQRVAAVAGRPQFEDGGACPLSVCALGKFGGREMGFASDIELLFIYESSGRSSGPQQLTNAQYFDRVAREFLRTIRSKREGVFEIDLRLRPYGSKSSLATSLAMFRRYFAVDGPAWPYERQLLLKLRPVAGDDDLGAHIMALRKQILEAIGIFDAGAMRAMRERQVRHLVTPGTINAKYSQGALVDLEYLVQGLQISYAGRHPSLIDRPNTREALARLREVEVLSEQEYLALSEALVFVRRVIDALRMVRGNAKDLNIPTNDSQQMFYLARRLGLDSANVVLSEVDRHAAAVTTIGTKLLP